METRRLLVTIQLTSDCNPMALGDKMEELLRDTKREINNVKWQFEDMIWQDWDDPVPASLSITVSEVKDEKG